MKLPVQEELANKMREYQIEEGRWIDGIVREQYPKWVIWLAENFFRSTLLRIAIAKYSGISVKRNQNTDIGSISGRGGFRPGKSGYKIVDITTSVFRKGKKVAERRFELNLHVRDGFNPSMLDK